MQTQTIEALMSPAGIEWNPVAKEIDVIQSIYVPCSRFLI